MLEVRGTRVFHLLQLSSTLLLKECWHQPELLTYILREPPEIGQKVGLLDVRGFLSTGVVQSGVESARRVERAGLIQRPKTAEDVFTKSGSTVNVGRAWKTIVQAHTKGQHILGQRWSDMFEVEVEQSQDFGLG